MNVYLYKDLTPNAQGLTYYYQSLAAAKSLYNSKLLATLTLDKYIYNNVLPIALNNTFTRTIIDNITYIIFEDGAYYKMYYVDSIRYETNMAFLNLSEDLWGSYIAKCEIEDINILRSNMRHYYTGVLPAVSNIKELYNKTDYLTHTAYGNNMHTIIQINFANTNSEILQSLNTNNTLTLYIPATQGLTNLTLKQISEIVQGIKSIDGRKNECTATALYFLPEELLNVGTGANVDVNLSGTNHKMAYKDLSGEEHFIYGWEFSRFCIEKEISLQTESLPEYELYFGSLTNRLKLVHGTRNISVKYILNIASDLRLLLRQGANDIDLTNNINFSMLKGSSVSISDDIKRLTIASAGVVHGIANLAAGNIVGGLSSVAAGANRAVDNASVSNSVTSGDALSTYGSGGTGHDGIGMLYAYRSYDDQRTIINYSGATYNFMVPSLADLLLNRSFICDNLGFIYIQADVTVNNVPTVARDYIANKFTQGIHFYIE